MSFLVCVWESLLMIYRGRLRDIVSFVNASRCDKKISVPGLDKARFSAGFELYTMCVDERLW